MRILESSHPRRFAAICGAILASAAVFGAGFITARATGGDAVVTEDPAPAHRPSGPGVPSLVFPSGRAGGTGTSTVASLAPVPSPGRAEVDRSAGLSPSAIGFAPNACPAALPGISTGSGVDLARVGFAFRPLSDGFLLGSFSVRAEGPCGENGRATTGTPVVETSWVHATTGFELSIVQRIAGDPAPNVLSPQGGQVWSDGYTFNIWVNAYAMAGADGRDIARAPSAQADGRGEEVLRLALAQLAPTVADRCYYRQQRGSWADLARMGIGDPRPSIPAGLNEQYSEFVVFADPAADCTGGVLDAATSFSAAFGTSPSAKAGTLIQVGAYPVGPGGDAGYGYLNDGNASWSNGKYAFSVSGYADQGPLPRATIEAIARTLDPGFSTACLVQTRELRPAELSGLGFRAPIVPDGFKLVRSSLAVTEAPAPTCGGITDAASFPQLMLNWALEGNGAILEVNVFSQPGQAAVGGEGYIQENGLNWTDAKGTHYAVFGNRTDGASAIDRDLLIAVARSIDPTFDPASLVEGPETPIKRPLPVPARN